MLHAALPALEALHKTWSAQKMAAKYSDFYDGLTAGLDKVAKLSRPVPLAAVVLGFLSS